MSIRIPIKNGTGPGGKQYSEEDRAAYAAKWENFASYFKRTPVGQTREVRGRITRIVGPMPMTSEYQGQKTHFTGFDLEGELRHPGMEGLRFNISGIKMSLHPKAKLNHLYSAVTGEEVPDSGAVDFEPAVVGTRDVNFVIKKGKPRPAGDTKRGGFYANVVDFAPNYDALELPADPINQSMWEQPEVPAEQQELDDIEALVATVPQSVGEDEEQPW